MKHFPDFPTHFHVPGGARAWHPKEIAQYERAAVALQYVTGWDMAVDVGAFGGVWSYAFARHFAAVQTFEPSEVNFRAIVHNLVAYPHVTVHNVALLDRITSGSMHSGGGKYEYLKVGEGTVAVATLDSLALPACDLLKIDAEGADALVLQGAEQTITKYSPVIIAEEKDSEVGRFGLNPGAVNTLLTSWGYVRIWQHDPDGIYVRGR